MPRGLTEKELDEQFELFLKEPVSDESVDLSSAERKAGTQGRQNPAQGPEAAPGLKDDERSHRGLGRDSRFKLVAQHHPETSALLDNSHKDPHLVDSGGLWSSGSGSSLAREKLRQMSEERRSDCSPAAGTSARSDRDGAAVGFDTLEEEEEKTRFFARLRAEGSSPLDYSRLLGELDSTGSTAGRKLGTFEEAAELRGPEEGAESLRECPAVAGSPQYSEDFEEEGSGMEEQVCKEPEILAKGQVNVQSGGLEMEAVREACRQIQEHSNGVYQQPSGVEGGGAGSRALSLSTPSPYVRESLQPMSTIDSDLATASELMKPICPEKDDTRDTNGEKRSHTLEGTFYVEPCSEQPKLLQQSEPLTSGSSAEPPTHNHSWSLRQEADRLIEDHNTGSSHMWSLDPNPDKHACHSATSLSKKASVASLQWRGVEGGAALSTAAGAQRRQALPPPTQQQENKASKHKEPEEDAGPRESTVEVLQRPSSHQQDRLTRQRPSNREKLWTAEEAKEKVGSAWSTGSDAEEKFQQMQKEIKEQEILIKGYQQENEKLYLQLKTEKCRSKAKEDSMLQEHQRLLSQLAFSRGSGGSVDQAEHRSGLLAEISRLQRKETQLSEDVDRLQQENQALLADLQLMKTERELAKAASAPATGSKPRVERSAPEKQQQKLQPADAARLKAASADIQQLKEQVEKMKMAMAKRGSDPQQRAREKSADARRMQELERHVRELQGLLGNPSSLPAPIPSATTAGGQGNADAAKNSSSSRLDVLLQLKIQRLEAELENQDQEAKRSFQAMEQQFHTVRVRYEQHISELQQRLEAADVAAEVQARGEALQRVNTGHQERERCLQDEIKALQQQLKHKARSSPGRHDHAEAAFGVRIERLNQELSAKTRTIQELSRSVDRLQKEKRNVLTLSSRQPPAENQRAERRQRLGAAEPLRCCPPAAEDTFPAARYQKTYKPTVFADSHISDVLQENEALKQHLERLELRSEQEKEALKVEVARAREELLRMQEESAERQAAHALQRSSSQAAQLANQLHTQQITVNVLKEQLVELQATKDELELSRRREEVLQQQLGRLLGELKEATDAQSPEVKLLCSLEKKLVNMELRHQSREKELQQVIGQSWQTTESDKRLQVESWRREAENKKRELDAFRQELDSILDILRYLQREGVVFSFPGTSTTHHVTSGLLKELS